MCSITILPLSSPHLPLSSPLTLERIQKSKLPSQYWNIAGSAVDSHIYFYKLQDIAASSTDTNPIRISHALRIDSNLTWKVTIFDREISKESSPLSNIPEIIDEDHVAMLLTKLDALNVCSGHPEQYFIEMLQDKNGKLYNSSGGVAAFLDNTCSIFGGYGEVISRTIRTSNCLVLTEKSRCANCMAYRPNLRSIYSRWLKRQAMSPSQVVNTSSHINDRWLTTSEREEKTKRDCMPQKRQMITLKRR